MGEMANQFGARSVASADNPVFTVPQIYAPGVLAKRRLTASISAGSADWLPHADGVVPVAHEVVPPPEAIVPLRQGLELL
jgi:hypothetical protein